MRNLVIERILELETILFWIDSLADKVHAMSNKELLDLYSEMLLEYRES